MSDAMKPYHEEVPLPATRADIKRLETKIDQLNDRLDTLLMEGGRGLGGQAHDVMQKILSQTGKHPAMSPQAQQMLQDILKPLMETGK
jgi:hypothetical protein